MKYQTEIPEQSHKPDEYSTVFLIILHFTYPVDTFLSTLYHIRKASLTKFLETPNTITKS